MKKLLAGFIALAFTSQVFAAIPPIPPGPSTPATTDASQLTTGTLAAARGGAGTINGALKGNGSGVVSQAACADLSNGATGCSTVVGTMATQNASAIAVTGGTIGSAVTGVTQPTYDNSTKLATTGFVQSYFVPRGYIAGCTLSTAGSSAVFSVTACQATSSDQTTLMSQPGVYTKTLASVWTAGSGNGCADQASTPSSTWFHEFEIERTDTGVVDYLCSQAPGTNSTATITIASPAVVTWSSHGLAAGAPVVFTSTGALPTGITSGTQYYVISAGLGTGTFEIAATNGGAAINTSGSQSGTHTATANPIMPTNYTKWRRIGSMLTNGSAQWTGFYQTGNKFIWLVAAVEQNNTTWGTGALFTQGLTVPPGVVVEAFGNMTLLNGGSNFNAYIAPLAATGAGFGTGTMVLGAVAGAGVYVANSWQVLTSTGRQAQFGATTGSSGYISTWGWNDSRGANN